MSPIDKFREVVSRVKSELINIEVYFYREKFMTYKVNYNYINIYIYI